MTRPLVADEVVDGLGGCAGHVEPSLEADDHDRSFERAEFLDVVIGPKSRTSTGSIGRSVAMSGQGSDDVVDAVGQRVDVGRVDRREHADAQLVAAELAVRVGVERRRWPAAPR